MKTGYYVPGSESSFTFFRAGNAMTGCKDSSPMQTALGYAVLKMHRESNRTLLPHRQRDNRLFIACLNVKLTSRLRCFRPHISQANDLTQGWRVSG